MSESVTRPAGKYYEELGVGQTWKTPARTITEADLVSFAGWSGDYNPLHTDEEFAKASQFGRRIFHGPGAFAIATGLESRLGIKDGTAIAFLGMTWTLKAPIFIGDTIHIRQTVVEKRESKKTDRGIINFDVKIMNQRDEVTQEGIWIVMFKRKPA